MKSDGAWSSSESSYCQVVSGKVIVRVCTMCAILLETFSHALPHEDVYCFTFWEKNNGLFALGI